LSSNSGVLTCVANDIGYEIVYSYQLDVKSNQDDLEFDEAFEIFKDMHRKCFHSKKLPPLSDEKLNKEFSEF